MMIWITGFQFKGKTENKHPSSPPFFASKVEPNLIFTLYAFIVINGSIYVLSNANTPEYKELKPG